MYTDILHNKIMFIFARGMKSGIHSHAAYQDFIRHVGAPDVILTDNARTQTGKK